MQIGQQTESQEQGPQRFTPQSQNEFALVPLVSIEDDWILSDAFLESVFDKVVDQGLLKRVFWEGTIANAEQFIGMMKSPNNHVVMFFEGENCVGFAWLSSVTSNYAFGHFCHFREIWGNTVEIGKTCVDYWFSWPGDAGKLLDVIVGIMPKFNKFAHKYVEKLGWTRLGVVPGMFRDKDRNQEDAVIYYISR